jgi:multidrug resistance efflux pump
MQPRSRTRRTLLAVGLLTVLGAAAAGYAVSRGQAAEAPIPGLVRVTEIKIAPEISGRMKSFRVRAGDVVHRGDVLAEVDNPELAAAVVEARAAVDLARATRDRVYAGLRREQVDILAREVDKVGSDGAYAQQQLQRTAALASRNNASRQDLDQATAEVALRQSALNAAKARHAAGVAGPTLEERNAADAAVALAAAALTSLERRLDKTLLAAPVDGIVQLLVAEPGEAIVPGQPIMTINAAGERWITFNVREDRLDGIDIGTQLDLVADGGRKVAAHVTEIRVLGEFATWRAARASGDHDLNTFLVRADPLVGDGQLEAGMTVWMPR